MADNDNGALHVSITTPEMTDDGIRDILSWTRTIAMIGASPDSGRPSNRVMEFLRKHDYRVIPVNPTIIGDTIHGETVVASLDDITEPVDMVDIFRRSEQVGEVIDQAIVARHRLGIGTVWLQLGVIDESAATRARTAGLDVVMDRCPAIEIPRLGL